MTDIDILERRIILKYQLLSLINEEIAELEEKRMFLQVKELEEKKQIMERLEGL